MPGATVGLHAEDPTIAELPKPLGYATGQFGKNHLGDRDEYLPTVHGFDEFFGNLYHLNAEEEPELPDYPDLRDVAKGRLVARALAHAPASAILRYGPPPRYEGMPSCDGHQFDPCIARHPADLSAMFPTTSQIAAKG